MNRLPKLTAADKRALDAFRRWHKQTYGDDPGPRNRWCNQDAWRWNDFIGVCDFYVEEVKSGRTKCPCKVKK